MKKGALVSNALGTIAVSYSIMYCLLNMGRLESIKSNVLKYFLSAHEEHDEAKSVVSGTLTGLMFKSTSGVNKCLKGGLVGFGISALWAFGLKKQDTVQHYL